MGTAGASADIILQKVSSSSDEEVTSQVGLNLYRDSSELPGGFRERLLTLDAPAQRQDEANYATVSLSRGLNWDEEQWGGGFGQTQKPSRRVDDLRYGYTDGALALDNRIVMGYQTDSIDIILQNGRLEVEDSGSALTGWNDNSNVTLAAVTTDPHSGNSHGTITIDSNGGYMGQRYKGTLSDSTLRGVEVTFIAYAQRTSGSGQLRLQIVDSAVTASGSYVSNSSEYTFLTVTRTINGSATTLDFRVQGDTASDVWKIDDLAVFPTDGITFRGKPLEFEGALYQCCGKMHLKFDESDDAWYPAYYSDTSGAANGHVTGHESFEGRIYVARGSDDVGGTHDNYVSTADGATYSDPSNNSGDGRLAEFFVRIKNNIGKWALAKIRYNTTDGCQFGIGLTPTDAGSWGSEIQVGDSDRGPTGLYAANNTVFVGKEDGLYLFDKTEHLFDDIEPEANFFPHANNFRHFMPRGGKLYAAGGDTAFSLWTPFAAGASIGYGYHDISDLLYAPGFDGYGGGRVRGITQDKRSIWLAIDGAGKPTTTSVKSVAQTGANRASSTDGNNGPWLASDGGTLSNAIDTNGDGITAIWTNNSTLARLSGSADDLSDHLQATMGGNNFSIPSGATPTGVKVTIHYNVLAFSGPMKWWDIRLLKNGSAEGTSPGGAVVQTGAYSTTFGGSTDLWGSTFSKDSGSGSMTPTEFNRTTFGVEIQIKNVDGGVATPTIEAVEIQVFYTTDGSEISRIMKLDPVQQSGALIPNTVMSLTLSTPEAMGRHNDGTNSSLFIMGRSSNADASADEARCYRLRLPVRSTDPTAESTPKLLKKGYHFTAWNTFGFPDRVKTQAYLYMRLQHATSTKYVNAYYKTDDDSLVDTDLATWTLFGRFDNPEETISTSTTALRSYKRLRWMFEFISDEPNEAAEIVNWVSGNIWSGAQSKLANGPLHEWQIQSLITEDPFTTQRGTRTEGLSARDLTRLDTLALEPVVVMKLPPRSKGADQERRTFYVHIADKVEHVVAADNPIESGELAPLTTVLSLSLTEADMA